jgi:hypothetical protein
LKNLILSNGQTAEYKYTDDWSRPVYQLENGCRVVCVNLDGTYLHTMTREGEPMFPIKHQPVSAD